MLELWLMALMRRQRVFTNKKISLKKGKFDISKHISSVSQIPNVWAPLRNEQELFIELSRYEKILGSMG